MAYLYVIGGLLLLGVGGEIVVRGAVDLAARLGVSKLLIGLVVVAFGTSSPEIVVAVEAVLANKPDIAVGNVVGSNIANTLLVLGLGALVYPIHCRNEVVERDLVVMLAVTGFFIMLAYRGEIGALQGQFMLGVLLGYFLYAYFEEKVRGFSVGTLQYNIEAEHEFLPARLRFGFLIDLLSFVAGFAALIFGARFIVSGATELALQFGVTEGAIGLTIVAVGTSLPEIATIFVAAVRKHPEIAVGGIIGSNIINVLAVLGIAAWFQPVVISPDFLDFDLWVMLGAALVVMPFMLTNWRISRLEGLILLLGYGAFVYVTYASLPPLI